MTTPEGDRVIVEHELIEQAFDLAFQTLGEQTVCGELSSYTWEVSLERDLIVRILFSNDENELSFACLGKDGSWRCYGS